MLYLSVSKAFLIASLLTLADGQTLQITSQNIQQILGSYDLVLVNFYADWCRFSNMLKPIYEQASQSVKGEFPEEGGVAFGKVDCDKESEIAKRYHVSKYPTLKLFRHGQLMKKEYRGQRSVAAIGNFIRDQMKDPINPMTDLDASDDFDKHKRHVVGMFDSVESLEYKVFAKVASLLRDDCIFHSAIGPVSEEHRVAGNKIVFKPPGEDSQTLSFSGRLADHQAVHAWTTDKCIPLVREITFDNAEELTEEGLPFVILFHNPDDFDTPELFRNVISRELLPEKSSVNFLTADGTKFTHPLYHLGKQAKDLPVLAIDSFKHMYLWPHNPTTDLTQPGLLKQFIADLHSGKLHREFHNGPDPTTKSGTAALDGAQAIGGSINNVKSGTDGKAFHLDVQQQVITDPSGFRINVIRLMQHEGAEHIDAVEELNKIAAETTAPEVEQAKDEQAQKDEEKDKVDDTTPEVEAAADDSKKEEVAEDNEAQEEEEATEVTVTEDENVTVVQTMHKVKVEVNDAVVEEMERKKAAPPESVFNKLRPSDERYTLLQRDEL